MTTIGTDLLVLAAQHEDAAEVDAEQHVGGELFEVVLLGLVERTSVRGPPLRLGDVRALPVDRRDVPGELAVDLVYLLLPLRR